MQELPDKRQKMDSTENESCTVNRSSCSADSDQKQFDKLFVELIAESTADDDPRTADAMQWFKRASVLNLHEI